jgi:hypothetical protein
MRTTTVKKKVNDIFIAVGIDWTKADSTQDGGSSLDYRFGISPDDFLAFAERDIQGSDTRAFVNGLSNAKRAIDAQTDIVLKCLGISADKIGKPKIQLLNDIGIMAPRIIKKIRDTRNFLEHEYRAPTKAQVQDAIDIATLFIAACSRTLLVFPEDVLIFNKDAEEDIIHLYKTMVSISADWDRKVLIVYGVVNTKLVTKKVNIRPDNELYLPLVRLFVAVLTEKNIPEALNGLREALRK